MPRKTDSKPPSRGAKKLTRTLDVKTKRAASSVPALPAASQGDAKKARSVAGLPTFPVVGIGGSAGGLEAFTQLLEYLPVDTGMAFVVVQHIQPPQLPVLVNLLARATTMPVGEAVDGMKLEPNHVYVIPKIAMGLVGSTFRRKSGQEAANFEIDYFFSAMAANFGPNAIGVVLSGNATDGTEGLKVIRLAKGITFVQDERQARNKSMPQSAIIGHTADFVLPLEGIALELARIGRHVNRKPQGNHALQSDDDAGMVRLFLLLRQATGVDFAFYKPATIRRRIARRISALHLKNLHDYVEMLAANPQEVEMLGNDLLINVTSFFRDVNSFEALKTTVFPALTRGRSPTETIRIWVPGCSTGEEVYSIAICLLEYLSESGQHFPIQLFGSDISQAVIEKARLGIYKSVEVSPERLKRFFVKTEEGYQISKTLRDLCIFAKQNVTRDPPFSKLDLISCRNLLIYLGPVLQKRVMHIFHYGLRQNGFLMLGASESIGAYSDLFAVLDSKNKIFARRLATIKPFFEFEPYFELTRGTQAANKLAGDLGRNRDIATEVNRVILDRYAPAGVVVNDAWEIVQFRGQTSPYLEPAQGEASLNLLKMAREGLLLGVRTALEAAKNTLAPVRKEGLPVEYQGAFREVGIDVYPIKVNWSPELFYLVLFEERAPSEAVPITGNGGAVGAVDAKLRKELDATKAYLQSVVAEHETTNEELRAANEEILSSNEELQSTNEELETAKEELQSTNEELITLNEELQSRNLEVNQINSDLNNLLTTVNIPIIILSADLRIKRFTPVTEALLNVMPSDLGRPIQSVRLNVAVPNLEQLVHEVVENISMVEREVQDQTGRWFSMRIRPYQSVDKKITGVVIAFFDIDGIKRSAAQLQQSRDYAEAVVQSVTQPLLVMDVNLRIKTANWAFCDAFAVAKDKIENRYFFELFNGIWDQPELRVRLEKLVDAGAPITGFEMAAEIPSKGRCVFLLSARRINHAEAGQSHVMLLIEDITERKQAEKQKDDFIAIAGHELKTPITTIKAFTQILQARMAESGDETEALYLRKMDAQLNKLTMLVKDLLDVSKVQEGQLVFHEELFKLKDLVQETVDDTQMTVDTHKIVVQGNFDVTLMGDRTRLGQVLTNLLSNAIKYSPDAKKVLVIGTKEADRCTVTVQDFGMGISKPDAAKVFDRFFRVSDDTNETFPGLGLGLYISAEIIKRHGGELKVESKKGKGSSFSFTLPLKKKTAAAVK